MNVSTQKSFIMKNGCPSWVGAAFMTLVSEAMQWHPNKKGNFSMLTALLFWVIVGLVAGFLASVVMRGGGYGIVGDIIVGIVGALIGGFLMSLLGLNTSGGLITSIIVAFIGACILIAILRAVSRGTSRRI